MQHAEQHRFKDRALAVGGGGDMGDHVSECVTCVWGGACFHVCDMTYVYGK